MWAEDRQVNRQTDKQVNRQTDRQTDGQTDGQNDRQTGKQADRQVIDSDTKVTCPPLCVMSHSVLALKKTLLCYLFCVAVGSLLFVGCE